MVEPGVHQVNPLKARKQLLAQLGREGSDAELFGKLGHLIATLNGYWSSRWKRSLPWTEYVVDRWERAERLGFGKGSSIYDSSLVFGDVSVGTNTWIGPFTILDGTGGLSIGSHCSISAGVQIYTHDTVAWATSGGTAPRSCAPTSIGSRCYVGPNCVIAKGVTIGDGSIIGANSLVLHDIPDGVRAFGTPCVVRGPTTA